MFENYERIRQIEDPEERFVEASRFLNVANDEIVPDLRKDRDLDPGNIYLQEKQAILTFDIAMVSIERIKACRELVDEHGYSFVRVAGLLAQPVLKKDGTPKTGADGFPLTVPGLTRARVQHIYLGHRNARAQTTAQSGTKKKAAR